MTVKRIIITAALMLIAMAVTIGIMPHRLR
jgi:hypothetical protein